MASQSETLGARRGARGGAVEHAIQLLALLSGAEAPLGVTELAHRTGLHKSTISRLLRILEAARLVERDSASGRFRLGLGVVALAAPLLVDHGIAALVRPLLEDLAERTSETINFSIWTGDGAVSIEQALGSNAVRHFAPPGRRNPGHATATGKALLAHAPEHEITQLLARPLTRYTERTVVDRRALLRQLEKVRTRRYALNDGEFVAEVSAVAAVVRSMQGDVVGAIAATVPSYRFNRERRKMLVQLVLRTADDLSARLGHMRQVTSEATAAGSRRRPSDPR